MKYLDVVTGKEVKVWPWNKEQKKAVKENPERYLELVEE